MPDYADFAQDVVHQPFDAEGCELASERERFARPLAGVGLSNAQVAWWEDGCNSEPDARPYPDDSEELAASFEDTRHIPASEVPDPDSQDYRNWLPAYMTPEQQVAAEDRAHAAELAAKLWGPPPGEKQRALDLELQQAKSRGLRR
jgi:hypothetical protein